MKIIIMGAQGCGKSTQAELLSRKLNIPHISSGDIFRDLEKSDSDLGKRVWGALSSGKLVSDEDTMLVLKEELSKEKYKNGFIMDGFPRNLYQAQNSPFKPDVVLYLEISEENSIKRLLERKREDDTLELIKTRLFEYHKNTAPVLDYYRNLGILHVFNGQRKIEVIQQELVKEFSK
ncbi:MAG: nucleoside monophosphate kinase [bacterium]